MGPSKNSFVLKPFCQNQSGKGDEGNQGGGHEGVGPKLGPMPVWGGGKQEKFTSFQPNKKHLKRRIGDSGPRKSGKKGVILTWAGKQSSQWLEKMSFVEGKTLPVDGWV